MRVRFKAMLVDNLTPWTTTLLVAEVHGDDRTSYLCADGTWQTVGPGEAAPENAGVTLPAGAITAIAEVFHPRAGHKVEVDRLTEALTVERKRVDRTLDRLLGTREDPPT